MSPGDLRGRVIESVTIGWFIAENLRHPGRLFISLDGPESVEACTGSEFRLERRMIPDAFDVGTGMRYQFQPAPADHPLAQLAGLQISDVSQIIWKGWMVGMVIAAGNQQAIVADEADELFVSIDELPPDYHDAEIMPT